MTALGKRKVGSAFVFLMFVIPAFAAVLLSVEVPFVMSVGYSFTKWNGLDGVPAFVGLENYAELIMDDPGMMSALSFTFRQSVFVVVFINVIAMILAVLLDREIRGSSALRAAFFIPNIMSLVVVGYIWRFIFSRGFDTFHEATGFSFFMQSWLGDPSLAFVSVVIVTVWQAVGFYVIIYIVGLQVIPRDLTEAAMIDGAGGFSRFLKITLPLLMPSVTVAVFYAISNSLKSFDIVYSLTAGGPGTSTTPIALDIYRTAFVTNRFGYATAKSVVLFLLILSITFFQIRLFKKMEVEA